MAQYDFKQLITQFQESSLEQIFTYIRLRDIQLAILTYPVQHVRSRVNRVLRTVAARYADVLLVDVSQALAEHMLAPGSDLLAVDGGHPNAEGYGMEARYVMDALIEAHVLK